MNGGALIAAAGLLAFAAWWMAREPREGGGVDLIYPDIQQVGAAALESLENIAESIMPLQLWKMREVTSAHLNNPNVVAFLLVIRAGEGTSDSGGYKRLFGGGTFASFADHPRTLVQKSGYRSTAAGAYQFLESTWDETARIMGLRDFSPGSQDMGAVGRIAARGALDDVIAGRLSDALKKCGREWASLPGSPYGQPTISAARAREVFAGAGGTAYA